MPHFKRKRPKNRRAGCLMCKPQKMNGVKKRGDVRKTTGMLNGSWVQEWCGWLKEKEGREESNC